MNKDMNEDAAWHL